MEETAGEEKREKKVLYGTTLEELDKCRLVRMVAGTRD